MMFGGNQSQASNNTQVSIPKDVSSYRVHGHIVPPSTRPHCLGPLKTRKLGILHCFLLNRSILHGV